MIKVSELEALTEKFETVKSPEAEVIWGRGVDESLGDALKLSVIVTNFNSQAREILEKELTTVVTDSKETGDIFKTDIQMGTKVEASNESVAPKADDYDTLTTPREEANAQQTPNVSIFDYKEPAVVMEPQMQPAPQPFFTPGSGPQRIEESVDPLFHDEEDFQYKIETWTHRQSIRYFHPGSL